MLITQRHQRQYLACMHLLTAVLTVHFPERKEKTTSTSLKKFRIKCPLSTNEVKETIWKFIASLGKNVCVIYTGSQTIPAQIVCHLYKK